MYETVLRVGQPGVYASATDGTDTTVELWCNDHCDLLQVTGPGGDAVVDHVRSLVGVRRALVEGDERLLVTDACLKDHEDDRIEPLLARHDCLLVPPLRYADGEKWCRVLALDPANLAALYRDLADAFPVTVESKREVESVAADRPLYAPETALPDLSPRQREALSSAREAGYYRIPRETTTAELASEMGVDRRTFEEHLRRAENKLVDGFAEFY
ncbi:helix-turn-helix domain-containing protein [Halomicrococcus gelatinilyticus]|uniref:helix-turn-helix domain-containing protein n=1 Tax=Halomicrococcus gelatinilyticus TaxID=1702103 RepID=UPI002E11D253